jgi:hypothetical protein
MTFHNKMISLILTLIFYRDFQNNSLSNLSNSLSPPPNVTILYAFLFSNLSNSIGCHMLEYICSICVLHGLVS